MSFDFNPDEIFEMAEQIERNGAEFYRKAAKGFEGESTTLLEGLATMEDKHVKLFQDMRAGLSKKETETLTFDPDDQAGLYLRAFADRHVFDTRTKPADLLTGKETMEEILRMAIGLEKDSIVFYLGIKDAMANQAGRDRVEEIVREEMSHVTSLSKELRTVIGK